MFHSCSLVFHSCSLVFTRVHSCSLVFTRVHSCSIRVPFVFTRVHSCSFVFIRVPLVFIRVHSCSLVFIRVHSCSFVFRSVWCFRYDPLEKCFELVEICSQTANHFLGWQTTLYCVGQGHAKETAGEIPWVSGRLFTDSDTVPRQSSLENVYAKFSSIYQGSNRAVFRHSCEDCYVGQWIGLPRLQCQFLYTHVLFPNRFDELRTQKKVSQSVLVHLLSRIS